MMDNLLPLLTFFPLLAAGLLLLIPARSESTLKTAALGLALLEFVFSIPLFTSFVAEQGGSMQFVVNWDWIPTLGVSFKLGVDGISLLLVMLTTFLLPVTLLGTWNAVHEHVKGYLVLFFLMTSGMLGVFVALDLFVFYVFWELTLIPMYFLIGIWGGPRRIYAAVKFFLFTMAGSVLMLVAILYLYWHTGSAGNHTFDLATILAQFRAGPDEQLWLFGAFALAFAIKVPMFPVHTWLPDAHVEAPTGGSVILAGVLLKMGTYGFLRFAMPLFPSGLHRAMPILVALAVVGILYGAWLSIAQKDVKKLVAYSSVSHLGFVMLGLFALTPEGVAGAVLQMINHGISTGALFLAVGVIYERRHTRLIADFGGLARVMPIYAVVFMIVCLSSIGLPGTNGFTGEFLILLGAFKSFPLATGLATTGVIFAAVYILWMFQRVMYGPVSNPKNAELPDLSLRELAVFAPLLVLIFWIGIYPEPFLSRLNPAVDTVLQLIQSR
ncbi:MAG: NADH-quinone oxidoreductase subunit M [Candidatus Cloacimonetes bacterium]|nr:NADH-quinone oxidoreductase subunit M [Candidatus Cloacimonadota bacterium]